MNQATPIILTDEQRVELEPCPMGFESERGV